MDTKDEKKNFTTTLPKSVLEDLEALSHILGKPKNQIIVDRLDYLLNNKYREKIDQYKELTGQGEED